jgi:hypothetical protein
VTIGTCAAGVGGGDGAAAGVGSGVEAGCGEAGATGACAAGVGGAAGPDEGRPPHPAARTMATHRTASDRIMRAHSLRRRSRAKYLSVKFFSSTYSS